jgi:hypothetical protein
VGQSQPVVATIAVYILLYPSVAPNPQVPMEDVVLLIPHVVRQAIAAKHLVSVARLPGFAVLPGKVVAKQVVVGMSVLVVLWIKSRNQPPI